MEADATRLRPWSELGPERAAPLEASPVPKAKVGEDRRRQRLVWIARAAAGLLLVAGAGWMFSWPPFAPPASLEAEASGLRQQVARAREAARSAEGEQLAPCRSRGDAAEQAPSGLRRADFRSRRQLPKRRSATPQCSGAAEAGAQRAQKQATEARADAERARAPRRRSNGPRRLARTARHRAFERRATAARERPRRGDAGVSGDGKAGPRGGSGEREAGPPGANGVTEARRAQRIPGSAIRAEKWASASGLVERRGSVTRKEFDAPSQLRRRRARIRRPRAGDHRARKGAAPPRRGRRELERAGARRSGGVRRRVAARPRSGPCGQYGAKILERHADERRRRRRRSAPGLRAGGPAVPAGRERVPGRGPGGGAAARRRDRRGRPLRARERQSEQALKAEASVLAKPQFDRPGPAGRGDQLAGVGTWLARRRRTRTRAAVRRVHGPGRGRPQDRSRANEARSRMETDKTKAVATRPNTGWGSPRRSGEGLFQGLASGIRGRLSEGLSILHAASGARLTARGFAEPSDDSEPPSRPTSAPTRPRRALLRQVVPGYTDADIGRIRDSLSQPTAPARPQHRTST